MILLLVKFESDFEAFLEICRRGLPGGQKEENLPLLHSYISATFPGKRGHSGLESVSQAHGRAGNRNKGRFSEKI
jgi:hypothetical protein